MLSFDNGGLLVEASDPLPRLPDSIERLCLDFETTSGDRKLDSLNPWHNCAPYIAAVTWDDCPTAFALDVRRDLRVKQWLRDALLRSRSWVNHNVKYDAHVAQSANINVPKSLELVCTIASSKLIDSDRTYTGGYGLDAVSLAWLHEDISQYEHALKPWLNKNKDYGEIPYDVLGEYACQDVLTNRRLDAFTRAQMPEECQGVWATERKLTKLLFKMERRGVRVRLDLLKQAEFALMYQMVKIEEQLHARLGRHIRPHVNEDCHEVLCIEYGLPVLAWTNPDDKAPDATHNPSFDQDALGLYLIYPGAPVDVVKLMLKYRVLNTQLTLFVRPWGELQVDGILHPNFNQMVRTGRLACSKPNLQQCDKFAKSMIVPYDDSRAFISADASQIEFRTIVHYIQDEEAIEAFLKDPDTDFHQWVGDQVGTKRKPAKTINFMVGFGAGRKKTTKNLSANPDIVSDITAKIDAMVEAGEIRIEDRLKTFDYLCLRKGEQTYDMYHGRFPSIKSTSRRAEIVARQRGYVRNLAGRRRHLPRTHAHIAFNTINQSSAADIVKEAMVALDEAYEEAGGDLKIVINVHDELLTDAPRELAEDPRTMRDVVGILEHTPLCAKLRVPVRWSIGQSSVSWKAAGADDVQSAIAYDVDQCGRFAHARR